MKKWFVNWEKFLPSLKQTILRRYLALSSLLNDFMTITSQKWERPIAPLPALDSAVTYSKDVARKTLLFSCWFSPPSLLCPKAGLVCRCLTHYVIQDQSKSSEPLMTVIIIPPSLWTEFPVNTAWRRPVISLWHKYKSQMQAASIPYSSEAKNGQSCPWQGLQPSVLSERLLIYHLYSVYCIRPTDDSVGFNCHSQPGSPSSFLAQIEA